MHTNEIWTTFVAGEQIDGKSTEIVSQVQQMQSSRCYTASGGKLGCTSCHDPHSSPGENRIAFYRNACQNCHQSPEHECGLPLERREQSTAEDSCIVCHMPSLPSNVPHTANTDHRILRHPESATEILGSSSSPVVVFESENGQLSVAELSRATGIRQAQDAESSGNLIMAANAISQLVKLPATLKEDPDVLHATASAFMLVGNYDQASVHWKKLLIILPEHESALQGLSVIAIRMNDFTLALEYLNRLIKINDWESATIGQRALILSELGRTHEAILDAESGLKRNPGSLPLHDWLAIMFQSKGDVEKSQYHKDQGKRIRAASGQ
ncbi:MAG: hypothetical protein O2856_19995 [Planctomycetota bacterium]|nr:hypothetical protein [Planctomycetota bacterium]